MKNQSIDIDVVNEIVKSVFGESYSGKTKVETEENYPCDTGSYEIQGLGLISKNTLLGVRVKGRLNKDGSEIMIGAGKKDLERAEEYAKKYKDIYRKEVAILRDRNFAWRVFNNN